MKVASSKSDPAVIGFYFLKCVKQLHGCPANARTDPGTEHGILATIQTMLTNDLIAMRLWRLFEIRELRLGGVILRETEPSGGWIIFPICTIQVYMIQTTDSSVHVFNFVLWILFSYS